MTISEIEFSSLDDAAGSSMERKSLELDIFEDFSDLFEIVSILMIETGKKRLKCLGFFLNLFESGDLLYLTSFDFFDEFDIFSIPFDMFLVDISEEEGIE